MRRYYVEGINKETKDINQVTKDINKIKDINQVTKDINKIKDINEVEAKGVGIAGGIGFLLFISLIWLYYNNLLFVLFHLLWLGVLVFFVKSIYDSQKLNRKIDCITRIPPSTENLLHLVLLDPKKDFYIGKEGATGGRCKENTIVLQENQISRKHFCITFHNGIHYILDCGSTTGTFQHVLPHQPYVLSEGTRVKIGDSQFVVLSIVSGDASYSKPKMILQFSDGPSRGMMQTIGTIPITIGRRSSNPICVPDDAVMSGVHCKIQYCQNQFELLDLESTNGTGIRLSLTWEKSQGVPLYPGFCFSAGTSQFRVHSTFSVGD